MLTGNSVDVDGEFVEDPNATAITSFMRQEYPDASGSNAESILERVMTEMIGSRQVRLAERPSPESEVAMRDVVRKCIQQGCPIPVLAVSGPKKTVVGESIDIAELSALKVLACLNKRVQAHYPVGINVRIRFEDITGYYLEEGVVGLRETIERYVGDFQTLVKVMGYDFITPVRERTLMTEAQFRTAADQLFPIFMKYLTDSEHLDEAEWNKLESWRRLAEMGWQGMVPRIMRDYYHHRYIHLFPEYDETKRLAVTAKYLAGTLARHQLKALGVDPSWPGHFQINFVAPVPGAPKSMTSTRLFYRTVPLRHSKRHMPFWRAKGILKLNGETRVSLANWSEELDYHRFAVVFSDGVDKVSVKSDYLLID